MFVAVYYNNILVIVVKIISYRRGDCVNSAADDSSHARNRHAGACAVDFSSSVAVQDSRPRYDYNTAIQYNASTRFRHRPISARVKVLDERKQKYVETLYATYIIQTRS